MPYRRQPDYEGAWQHLYNRAIARRPLFERREDFEVFFGLLALLLAEGLLEVHAACLLTTHFHLLARSPRGEVARAMQYLLLAYARYFNRSRRRDGPLFRGRYGSKLVESSVYWETLVRYIDLNPVHAGMAAVGSDYPYGSASAYRWGETPPWLVRNEVEATVRAHTGRRAFRGQDYDTFVSVADPQVVRHLVERRTNARRFGPDLCDDLVRAAPLRVQSWMEAKAALADGTPPGVVLACPDTLCDLLATHAALHPDRRLHLGQRAVGVWPLLETGLLHQVAGLKLQEISDRVCIAPSTAHQRTRRHVQAVRLDPPYLETASLITQQALLRDLPAPARILDLPRRTPLDLELERLRERRENS